MDKRSRRLDLVSRLAAAGLVAAALTTCGSVDDQRFFLDVRSAAHPVTPATSPVGGGRWIVYFASEALEGPGVDLNGDGDAVDSVAVVIDVLTGVEHVLGVAAVEAAVVGDQVYLVVDEAAQLPTGTPLNPAVPAFQLAHWSLPTDTVVRFDEFGVEPGPRLFAADGSLYYASGRSVSGGANGTSLRFVEPAAPTVPFVVRTDGAGAVGGFPIGLRAGLLFVRLLENSPPNAAGNWPDGDLNADGDTLDSVLAVLDATDPSATLAPTGLALPATPGFDARRDDDGGAWLAAVLVDEVGQGVDLNDPALFDPAWVPEGCPGLAADGVVVGQTVLHYLRPGAGTPAGSAVTNTGLVGANLGAGPALPERVVVSRDVVATLGAEASAGCDLNGDGDLLDTVARWAEAVGAGQPVLPPGRLVELHAIDTTAGPSRGLAVLGERLMLVVDEAQDGRDHDGKAADHCLVGSRDPLEPLESSLVFEHRSGVADFDEELETFKTREPFVGVSWMAADPTLGRLPLTYDEAVPGEVLNRNDFCADVAKDQDLGDVVPAWPRLRSDSELAAIEPDFPLTFPGIGYAVFENNPGIVLVGALAFLRVSEQADRRDHNGDGDRQDAVLFVSRTASCTVTFLGTASTQAGPSVLTNGLTSAAFLADETQDGVDVDGDGDALDLVVRYFRF